MKYLKVIFIAVIATISFASCKDKGVRSYVQLGISDVRSSVGTLDDKDSTIQVNVSAVIVEYKGKEFTAEAVNDHVAKVLLVAKEHNLLYSVKGLVMYHPETEKYTMETAVIRSKY